MATEIASLLVTAEAQTGDAERGLDRLNQKYDKTVENLKSGQSRVSSFGDANRKAAGDVDTHAQKVDKLRGSMQSLAGEIRNAGLALTAGITVPLTAASAAATKFAGDLESKVSLIRTIRPDFDTSAVFKSLSLLQTRIPQTSDQLGEAAYNIVSSLDDIGEAATLNLTEKFGKGASAARVEALDFGTAILGVLNAYGMKVSDVDHIQDLFFQTVNKGIITGGELSRELAGVSKAAQNAGVDVETLFALIVGATKEAGPAAENMTQLSQVLNQFTSKDAQKGLKELGIETHDAAGNFRPFISILEEVKKKYDTLSQVDKSKLVQGLFPDIRSQKGFATLLRQLDDVKGAKDDPTKGGSTERAFETVSKTFNFQFEIFKNTFRHTLETLGSELLPILTPLVQTIGKFLVNAVHAASEAWKNLSPGVKTAIVAFLGFIASLGPVLTIVGTVAAGVLGLAGSIASLVTAAGAVGGIAALAEILVPVGLVIAGLAVTITEWAAVAVATVVAVKTAWSANFLGIRDLTFRAWNAIKDFLIQLWEELRAAYALIWPQLQTLTRTVLGAIQGFWTAHGEKIVAIIRFAWDVVTTTIRTAVRIISSVVTGVLAIINGDWQTAWDMAVRIADAFLGAFAAIMLKTEQAVHNLVVFLIVKAVQFIEAGKQWAVNLITGFVIEMITNGPRRMVAAVVVAAVSLTSPAVLGAFAAAGAAQARARNEAFEANLKVQSSNANPQRYEDEGEYVSGAPGYSNQAEKPTPTTSSTRGSLPAGFGDGKSKSGENAAVRKFKLEMQIAEVAVQAIERLNQKALSDAEYYYSQGIQDLDRYVEAKRKAADDLFKAENERNNQEVYALQASGLRGRQRDLAEAQLSEKVKATWQKHAVAITEIDRFEAAERLAIQRASQEAQISLAQESANGLEAVWRRLAEQGVSTFTEAQKQISAAQLEILRAQERNLVTKLGQSGNPGTAPFEQTLAQLQQIRQQIANMIQQMGFDLEDANQREEDRLLQHKARLDSIYNAIADSEADSARDRLRILENMGLRKEIVWRKQAELELQIEEMQSKRRIEDLERQRDYIEKYEKNEERRVELIRAINSQIEEEDRRSNQRRQNIMDEFYEKQRQKLKEVADKIVGVFKTALDRYREDGWKGFFKSLGESFRDQLEQMALDLMKSRVLQLLQTVFKVPQINPNGQQAVQSGDPGISGGITNIFGSILDSMRHLFGGGGQGQPLANHASSTASIDSAGKAMTEAISKSGERAAQGVEKQGADVTGSLTSVGQGIISTMLSIGSMLANANTRGNFWSGLAMAAGMGAINGLTSGLLGGGSGSQGGIGSAAANAIGGLADGGIVSGQGHDTSDNILGVDARTQVPTAWVSPNEFVVNAAMTRKHRALIEAINADRLPRYGIGGFLKKLSPLASIVTGGSSPLLPISRIFGGGGSWSDKLGAFFPMANKKARHSLSPFTALFGLAGGGIAGGSAGGGSLAFAGAGYMPPARADVYSYNNSTVHKHYHLNVTHRGGSDQKSIQKSMAQVQRAYSEMIQRTSQELN